MTTLADRTRTTHEVAVILGIGDSGVRELARRRVLVPIRRGARPLKFRALDVERVRIARESQAARDEVADVWAAADALASQVSGM